MWAMLLWGWSLTLRNPKRSTGYQNIFCTAQISYEYFVDICHIWCKFIMNNFQIYITQIFVKHITKICFKHITKIFCGYITNIFRLWRIFYNCIAHTMHISEMKAWRQDQISCKCCQQKIANHLFKYFEEYLDHQMGSQCTQCLN